MPDYTLSAKITGDSKSYKKAVNEAEKANDDLKESLDEASQTVEETESKTNKAGSSFSKLASKMGSAFTKMGQQIGSAFSNLGTKMQEAGTKMDAWGKKVQGLGAKMTLAITTPLTLAFKKMINAASDYDENLNKVDVAFKNNAQSVKDWADTATKAFGLSKNQALEATSLFGDMATSMGFTTIEAAEMAITLTGLAGDLASFKNIEISQAMTALNGVFTGETESLKLLGVVMTEANLQQYAFSKGINKEIKDMTQAEKVRLRYNYILDMTKNAQGDYARTADGTANSMRTFEGAVDNLNIALGQKLLPVFTPLIQDATDLINKFAEAEPKTQQLTLLFGALAIAAGPVLTVFGGAVRGAGYLIKGFGGAVKGVGSFVKALKILREKHLITAAATKIHNAAMFLYEGACKAATATTALLKKGLTSIPLLFNRIRNSQLLATASTKLHTAATVVWNGVCKTATLVTKGLGIAFNFLTSPIGLVVLAIGAVIAIGYLLITHWEDVKRIAGDVWTWIETKFRQFDAFLTGIFTTDWTQSFGIFGNLLNGFFATVKGVWDSIKKVFSGIIDFVAGIFTGNWERAWQGVVDIFTGIWGLITAPFKYTLNGIISLINMALDGINKISIDIPEWSPIGGGKHFGFNIPKIPYLLHGTMDWQGGFARMNEGGRGELTYLPNGSQVIPHDISVTYAKEAARLNTRTEPIDIREMLEGIVIQVFNQVSVDGMPLKEKAAAYTIRKISGQQAAGLRAKGVT